MSVGQCACVVCDGGVGGVGGVSDGGGDSFPSESMFPKKGRSPWKRETDSAQLSMLGAQNTQHKTQTKAAVFTHCAPLNLTLMPSLTKQQLTNHYDIKTPLQ